MVFFYVQCVAGYSESEYDVGTMRDRMNENTETKGEEMKLSELIKKELTRLNFKKNDWVDEVVIQRHESMTLVHFNAYHLEKKKRPEVQTTLWFDIQGHITMVDGRLSYNFYTREGNTFDRVVIEHLHTQKMMELDFQVCYKMDIKEYRDLSRTIRECKSAV